MKPTDGPPARAERRQASPGNVSEAGRRGAPPAEPEVAVESPGVSFDVAPTPVLLLQNGILKYANPEALRATGYAAEELIGRPLAPLLCSSSELVASRGGRGVDVLPSPLGLLARSGRRVWFLHRSVTVLHDGRPATLVLVLETIDDQPAEGGAPPAEFSLDVAPDLLLWIEKDGRLAYANATACRALGRSRCELLETSLFAVAPCFSEKTWPAVWGLLRQEGPITFDTHYRTADGAALPVEVTLSALRSDSGEHVTAWARESSRRREFEAALLRAQDELAARVQETAAELAHVNIELRKEIGERKEAERTLRAWQETHRIIVDNVADIVWTCDLDGYLTHISPSVERLLGYAPFELISTNIKHLISPADFAAALRSLVADAEWPSGDMEEKTAEMRLRHKLGHAVACETALRYLRNEDGERVGVIGTTRDVTERKRMEEALIRSERLAAVGTLSAGIAHEFNNINCVVLGSSDMLLEEKELPAPLRPRIAAIRDAALRAATITRNLLSFGAREVQDLGMGSLTRAVERALRLIEGDIERDGITLVHRRGETPERLMSEGQITQVALNLLTNARHALIDRPVKQILVETGSDEGGLFLRVSDTGCGIPKPHLTRVFTPFFSTKGEHARGNSPQWKVKGTGLGLSVSHTIVSNHGGTMSVESEENVGATFTVRLPLGLASGAAVRRGGGAGPSA